MGRDGRRAAGGGPWGGWWGMAGGCGGWQGGFRGWQRGCGTPSPADTLSAPRKVFFTDYGQIPKVERCDMDGQNRTKLVDSKIVFPHGITLDLVSRLVYWADAYLDYIEVVDYEGKGRQTIIQGILVRPLRCCPLGLPAKGRPAWGVVTPAGRVAPGPLLSREA